jgi:hypothetical protein
MSRRQADDHALAAPLTAALESVGDQLDVPAGQVALPRHDGLKAAVNEAGQILSERQREQLAR